MDELFLVWGIAQRLEGLRWLFQILTDSATYLVVFIIILLVFYFRSKEKAAKMLISIGLSLLTIFILKNIFLRPRPCTLLGKSCPTSFSFPSDHASRTFVLSYFEPYLLPWAVLVAFSRVILLHHYLSDVIFGAFWGIFCGMLGEIIWEKGKAFYFKKL